jgi:hypothetical protein
MRLTTCQTVHLNASKSEIMTLSVIGAGLGRTGTLSLRTALERLGLGPCYHMRDVFECPEHVEVWDRAADGKQVDWEVLLGRHRSAVDWPVCAFYRELVERYPQAKVILTTRDPERWHSSVMETIYPLMKRAVPEGDATMQAWGRMVHKLILEQTFGGRLADREEAIAVYERHHEAVRRTVPQERLLVYEVAQGWEPLCRFLGLPVPEEPFPQVNTKAEFGKRIVARLGADKTPDHSQVA